MRTLDIYLQQRRMAKASRFIPDGCTLLDIGCHQGELLHQLAHRIAAGTGIDPLCNAASRFKNITLINGHFPQAINQQQRFDCISALAIVEHIPNGKHHDFFASCFQFLNAGGLLICSIPSKQVDTILAALQFLKLVKGMSLEEHHGFDVKQTPVLAKAAGFTLLHHHRFQLGFNNLFVFSKPLG